MQSAWEEEVGQPGKWEAHGTKCALGSTSRNDGFATAHFIREHESATRIARENEDGFVVIITVNVLPSFGDIVRLSLRRRSE